jgi:hypothetical protein
MYEFCANYKKCPVPNALESLELSQFDRTTMVSLTVQTLREGSCPFGPIDGACGNSIHEVVSPEKIIISAELLAYAREAQDEITARIEDHKRQQGEALIGFMRGQFN